MLLYPTVYVCERENGCVTVCVCGCVCVCVPMCQRDKELNASANVNIDNTFNIKLSKAIGSNKCEREA